ncbi:MAG: cellulase family glycosylhydrolase [Opitutaceae bacterium]|jgi:hypothetical protein
MKLSLLLLLAAAFLPSLSRAAQTHEFPLTDIQPNGIARDWRDDASWADVDVEFRAGQVFEELKAQRIVLKHITRGRAQLAGSEFSIKKGSIYTVTLRTRSMNGSSAPVEFAIRDPRPPYKDFATRRTVNAPSDWQSLSFFFEGKDDLENYRLYLAFPQPCDVEIERITIREESRAEFDARSSESTRSQPFLHANPTFALGSFGWSTFGLVDRDTQYPLESSKQYSLEPPAITNRLDTDGNSIGVLGLGESTSVLLSTLMTINPGNPVHIVGRVRRTVGSGPVTLKLFSPNWANSPSKRFTVGTEWSDITLSGTPPLEEGMQVRIELSAPGEGELEIAKLALTQNPEAVKTSTTINPTAFGPVPDRAMTLYEVGETPLITLNHTGGNNEQATWHLVDVHDQTVQAGTWTLPKDSAPAMQSFENLPVGWYQLKWSAPWATVQPAGVINIAIVPPATRIAGDRSHFGIHLEGSEVGVRKMQLLGAHWLRTNNPLWTKWSAVQPERDVWVYPDLYVDRFTNAGLGIIFDLDRTPRWAARNPDNYNRGTDYMDFRADLPADLDAWGEYVRRMVTRYKDRVHYWEIWNEPDITFLRPPAGMTNAEAYMELLKHASPIIREIDPSAKIIMSPAYYLKKRGSPDGYQEDFTQRFIEAGGMKYVDIYSIHFYLSAGQRTFDRPEIYQEKLDQVRVAQKAAGRTPEIWNSEWGIINFTVPTHPVHLPSTNGITADQAARELVAWSVGMLAGGVDKLVWFDGLDNFYYHFHVTRNLFDYREPKPTAVAYAVLSSQLDGFDFKSEEPVADHAGRVLVFSNGQREVRVAYGLDGASFTLTPPAGAIVTDYLGQSVPLAADGTLTVGEAPLYLSY